MKYTSIMCQIRQPALKVDQAILDDIETCLTPVTTNEDRDATLNRIHEKAKSLPIPSIVTEKFERFGVCLAFVTNDTFSLKVIGPGHNCPGTTVR